MHLYHDPNRHFIHTPSIFIALTFDLDLQNIEKSQQTFLEPTRQDEQFDI